MRDSTLTKEMVEEARQIDRRVVEGIFNTFLVRSFGYWGKGETLKEAKANCLKQRHNRHQHGIMLAHWGTADIECLSDGSVTATNMVFLGEV